MPDHNLSPRQYLILGLVALCAPLGDTCLSRGMTHIAAISLAHPMSLIAAVFTPWVGLGILLLIGFFASYLTALSWADLTFVLPATAFGNVIVAIFARFWLHEAISLERWAGIALITIGVGFVAHGPSRTEPVAAGIASGKHELIGDSSATISVADLKPAEQPVAVGRDGRTR